VQLASDALFGFNLPKVFPQFFLAFPCPLASFFIPVPLLFFGFFSAFYYQLLALNFHVNV